ncbi:MAG: virulence factor MviN [Gammaproteobacteria bacterium]|nr:virulence factor MviN [Gammaproteobacteria bacterium]
MKQIFQLGLLSALNIFTVFIFQWYVLIQVGPGEVTDAFFAGMAVPQLVAIVVSGSLMHVLVPLLTGESEESFHKLSWTFLLLVGALFFTATVILYFFAPWWVQLIVPGFDEAGIELTVELTRIHLIGMFFTAINGVQWAVYHARQQFLWSEFAPTLAGLFAFFLLIWALSKFGIVAAAWIGTIKIVFQTLMLLPCMGRPTFPGFRNEITREAWRRIKPLLIGNAYYKTDILVDRFLLSLAGSGSLSLYYFGQQIFNAITQIINKAIAVPLVPALSICHKSRNIEKFKFLYRRKMLLVLILCLIGLLVLMLFGADIVTLFVGYGNFNTQSVDQLLWIMIWLGGMLIGGAAGQVASSTFYSMGDTTTPTRMSVITYTIYIPVKISMFFISGTYGLALSTSVYYLTNLTLQMYLINRRWKLEHTF